jgi:hypothetical protein
MRRSRTYPSHGSNPPAAQQRFDYDDDDDDDYTTGIYDPGSNSPVAAAPANPNAAAALIHNIASFLTLSDAASLVSNAYNNSAVTPADSWAVGVELETDHSWTCNSIATPLTPALVAVSPGATPHYSDGAAETNGLHRQSSCGAMFRMEGCDDDDDEDEEDRLQALLQERRRRWAQEKITSAVFSHPRSLRSYCLEAYRAANDIRTQKELAAMYILDESPETQIEPIVASSVNHKKRKRKSTLRAKVVFEVVDWILHSVPVSVLLDVLEAAGCTTLDTTDASWKITVTSLQNAVAALGNLVVLVWDTVTHCVTNPFQVLEAIISLQFNAMGKTSEVLVSGIQSVATGMGSASSLALYRLSATANMSSSASLAGLHGHHRKSAGSLSGDNQILNKKLLRKLSTINDAALVVKYRELEDGTGGLTRHAVSRTRRMMHYSVSLRPFVATVTVASENDKVRDESGRHSPAHSVRSLEQLEGLVRRLDSASPDSLDDENSPFMCTPQSFPPTPHSRQNVINQRSQLSDDVVFLARDRLRVHDGLGSADERTRERSQVLESNKRLAIFDYEEDSGIELTCGRHIATKVGNVYYASARSMVAVLRNCFVYFEFSILPRSGIPFQAALPVATLSIGLSTEEMPPNTLVGAWQGSVGLCTTGQILLAGQWCSPADPSACAYGVGATVGCLVCLDDESAFETWDGVMVKATIRFNVNGVMVSPPVTTLPVSGANANSTARVGSPMSLASSLNSMLGGSGDGSSPAVATRSPPDRLEPHAATLNLLVPSAEALYPTVTLQSSATSVACRFSSEDIIASTRDAIGAPPNVAVYGVDGSVILNIDDEVIRT